LKLQGEFYFDIGLKSVTFPGIESAYLWFSHCYLT
jgi:hypothetical protein